MSLKKNRSQGLEEPCSDVEEQSKVLELRSSLGDLAGRSLKYCSDDCLKRYLCARNWNVKKAEKMLKESIKWRESYKPEDIRWVQVAKESETGKVFRANFADKFGRTVLIMHPARQNTTSHDGQIRQLVYCMENAILNLPANREQMVWLIHFHGWTLYKSVPIKTARETANVLQNHFPERLALAILYNPPRIFETFWAVSTKNEHHVMAGFTRLIQPPSSSMLFIGMNEAGFTCLV
ncbi:hypothetical protein O6H91_Y133100 [Diphasiastrum complanatum]|nr:hypothetical protein O6H91_Y133100 [Diphasiastrum complanatum]